MMYKTAEVISPPPLWGVAGIRVTAALAACSRSPVSTCHTQAGRTEADSVLTRPPVVLRLLLQSLRDGPQVAWACGQPGMCCPRAQGRDRVACLFSTRLRRDHHVPFISWTEQ